MKKRLVVDLPNWVSVAHLVPPAVDPDCGIDRVVIGVSLGDRDGKRPALRKSITWVPTDGWSEAAGRLTSLSFPLASLPDDLRKIPREALRFHVSVRIESRGDVLQLERTQAVSFGTDFLISGTLPVRAAEFRGTLLPWSKLSADGVVKRVDITLRSGKSVVEGSLSPSRHNDEYGPPAPVRFIFLAGEDGAAPVVKAEVVFVLADGTRVPWAENRQPDQALPFSIDLLFTKP